MKLGILYEDDTMIVCNKPSGVLAQSGKSFDVDMVSALRNYRKKKGEDTFIGVINRLDRQVSGIMVFAKTKETAAKLNKLMQANTFDKQYYAVICGKPVEQKGTFVDYLLKDERSNTSEVVVKDCKDAKRAELEYEVIKSIVNKNLEKSMDKSHDQILTLVKIHLITGRHHQIRIQFASRGMALVGDSKYGNADDVNLNGFNGIALCAYALQIEKQKFQVEPEERIFKLFD